MKKIFKNYLTVSFFLTFVFLLTSCTEEDLDKDAGKVVPYIFNFNGAEGAAFLNTSGEYSVTPIRGGSEYIWTVTGASYEVIDGAPNRILVTFDQPVNSATISVAEKVANGAISETLTKNLVIFSVLCEWSVEMYDSYGDGWNGGSLSYVIKDVDIQGTLTDIPFGEMSIDSGGFGTEVLLVPDQYEIDIVYNSGDWDSEVGFVIYDDSDSLIYFEGFGVGSGVRYTHFNDCQ